LSVLVPSFSSQAIHGAGSAPGVAAPPATDGFSAVRFVLMFSEGILLPAVRSCPSSVHAPPPVAAALAAKRLAKICFVPPRFVFGSYQDTHGTVRPAPAKSIDGASASFVVSTLSDAGKPSVTHAPFLKARTKMFCAPAVFCSNVPHGISSAPAV